MSKFKEYLRESLREDTTGMSGVNTAKFRTAGGVKGGGGTYRSTGAGPGKGPAPFDPIYTDKPGTHEGDGTLPHPTLTIICQYMNIIVNRVSISSKNF